jgi:GNAT superfamily N-acetyltransferase
MEQAVDIWELTGTDHALYCTVDQVARGLGIERVLMERTRDQARSAGYPQLSVICTSKYSIKIASDIGMRSIYTLHYSEYKDEKEYPVFTPPHPHTQPTVFVLKLDADIQ